MKPDLEELKITPKNLEKLTGYEVNESFIGGIFGVFRPSRFPKQIIALSVTELAVFLLTFILTIPFGFLVIRDRTDSIHDLSTIVQFLQIPLGITIFVIISWNIYMIFKAKSLKTLMNLLDEVDKYNEVIQAVDLLDKLEATGIQPSTAERLQTLKALDLTRNSIICGLMTEKILRENRYLLARRYELCANIENYLVTLRNMEVQQAHDYAHILRDALKIGVSVQQEVQKF